MNRPLGKLVYSTRWFDEDEVAQRGHADRSDAPANLLTIEIVIHDDEVARRGQARDERLNALSRRPNLFNFLKSEVRSHVAA